MSIPPEAATTNTGGSVILAQKTVTAAAYTVTKADQLIRCDATANAQVLQLPDASLAVGSLFTFKKIDASNNMSTIKCFGSQLVDLANSLGLVTQGNGYTMQSNGVGWDITSAV